METFSKNDNIKKVIAKNFKSMRIQAGLTKEGVAVALDLSISYILMIERGAANISSKTATLICNFFEIEFAQLYSKKIIKIKPILKLNTLKTFYKENEKNHNFFIEKRKEYSTAAFIKEVLIPEKILDDYIVVGEILKICDEKFKRKITSQALSRELRRAYLKGILERNDKYNNGSIFEYKIKFSKTE